MNSSDMAIDPFFSLKEKRFNIKFAICRSIPIDEIPNGGTNRVKRHVICNFHTPNCTSVEFH